MISPVFVVPLKKKYKKKKPIDIDFYTVTSSGARAW